MIRPEAPFVKLSLPPALNTNALIHVRKGIGSMLRTECGR
jgi:hypothetical protein